MSAGKQDCAKEYKNDYKYLSTVVNKMKSQSTMLAKIVTRHKYVYRISSTVILHVNYYATKVKYRVNRILQTSPILG